MAANESQLLSTSFLEATNWPTFTQNLSTTDSPFSGSLLSTELASSELEPMTSSHIVVLLVAFIPLMLCILVGNFFVMVTVYFERRLHTPTHVILGSLAVADFLTGALTIPLELYTDAKWNTLDCYAVTYMLAPTYYLGSVSLMHQIIVTWDRLIAVCRPLRYYNLVTSSRVTMVISSVWILGTLPLIFFLYVWLDSMAVDQKIGYCSGAAYFNDTSIKNFEISLSTIILSTLILLTILNVYIWCIAAQQAQAQQIHAHLNANHPEHRRKNLISLQATKTVLFIVGTFIVSWTPFSMYSAMASVIQENIVDKTMVFVINQIAYFFVCMNSAINPLIYGWKNIEFRRALLDLVRRWRIACPKVCQRMEPAKTTDDRCVSIDMFVTETALTNINYDKSHEEEL